MNVNEVNEMIKDAIATARVEMEPNAPSLVSAGMGVGVSVIDKAESRAVSSLQPRISDKSTVHYGVGTHSTLGSGQLNHPPFIIVNGQVYINQSAIESATIKVK